MAPFYSDTIERLDCPTYGILALPVATTTAVTLHCIGLFICCLDTAGHNMAESGALMEAEGRDGHCTLHAHTVALIMDLVKATC
jgi:hypothetical protein